MPCSRSSIRDRTKPHFSRRKDTLKYMGRDSDEKTNRPGGKTGWGWVHTYGGKIVENIVQATARDLMANGMKNVEADCYPVVLTVHDELVSEIPATPEKMDCALAEFIHMMCRLPDWAQGCPVAAEGWIGKRYRK